MKTIFSTVMIFLVLIALIMFHGFDPILMQSYHTAAIWTILTIALFVYGNVLSLAMDSDAKGEETTTVLGNVFRYTTMVISTMMVIIAIDSRWKAVDNVVVSVLLIFVVMALNFVFRKIAEQRLM